MRRKEIGHHVRRAERGEGEDMAGEGKKGGTEITSLCVCEDGKGNYMDTLFLLSFPPPPLILFFFLLFFIIGLQPIASS